VTNVLTLIAVLTLAAASSVRSAAPAGAAPPLPSFDDTEAIHRLLDPSLQSLQLSPLGVPPTDSVAKSFWVGEELPQPVASLLHEALTAPSSSGPSILGTLASSLLSPLMPGMPPHWPNKFRDYSRVLEFDPLTLEVVWEYRLDKPGAGERKFFSVFLGSAQRLPNGNTLVTEGVGGRVFELTPGKEIVWEYISPFVGPAPGGANAVYRAYRVPREWLPARLECP
jgi:hypothetical protein